MANLPRWLRIPRPRVRSDPPGITTLVIGGSEDYLHEDGLTDV